MNRKKLPRFTKSNGNPYVTGTEQSWTYEYTWEDWEASVHAIPSSEVPPIQEAFHVYLIMQFIDQPEELMCCKSYQALGLRPEGIADLLRHQLEQYKNKDELIALWNAEIEAFNR